MTLSTRVVDWNGHGWPTVGDRGHGRQRPWFPCKFGVSYFTFAFYEKQPSENLRSVWLSFFPKKFRVSVFNLDSLKLLHKRIPWWLALARKKMWLWIASFLFWGLLLYLDDALHYAKQLVLIRLLQMTKYFVMESVSILVIPLFGHKKEFKFLNIRKVFGDLFHDLTSFFCISKHLY